MWHAGSGPSDFAALFGAFASVFAVRRRAMETAVAEERRRLARELHDGLAQELAYIHMETLRLAAHQPDHRVARLARAAQRALEESRGAIAALQHESCSSFECEISDIAHELAERAGAKLSLEIEPALEVSPLRRRELIRIVQEAISNGVQHGRATEIALAITSEDGLRVAIRDNGRGFVPGGPRPRGSFGLTNMRERAEALGGAFTVRSAAGRGTLVEVVLP